MTASAASQLRHGHGRRGKRSPEYITWQAMRARCLTPTNPGWKDYGGRGIKICDRWMVFENFLEDMGQRPPGMSIDRINTNGNYEPSNCRWATAQQQTDNRNPSSRDRLTPVLIAEIRSLKSQGARTVDLAKRFGVHKATIERAMSDARRRRNRSTR